jgi:hypothetical protein
MKAEEIKPRNFVAKNAPKAGAGAHKDKKKAMKRGDQKHKGKMDEANYEHPAGKELSRLGRIIMDKAVTTKDDKLSNIMSKVGNELTMFGGPGGASSLPELEKKTGVPYTIIEKLMKFAMKQKDTTLSKVKDPEPNKNDLADFEQ